MNQILSDQEETSDNKGVCIQFIKYIQSLISSETPNFTTTQNLSEPFLTFIIKYLTILIHRKLKELSFLFKTTTF